MRITVGSYRYGGDSWFKVDSMIDKYKYTYERRRWKKKGEEKKSQAGDDDVEVVTD